MNTKCRWFFAAVLALSLQAGFGQTGPIGLTTFSFNSAGAAVFDLTGDYQFDQQFTNAEGTVSDFSFGVSLSQDVQGHLSGSGWEIIQIGDSYIAAYYTATGRVTGSHGTTRAMLSVNLSGSDTIAGVFTSFQISSRFNLTVSSTGLDGSPGFHLVGTGTTQASFGSLGKIRVPMTVSVPLPSGMDGSWVAQMDIFPLNRLGGTGTITLSNGRVLQTKLTGTYSASTTLSKVRLSGTGSSSGTTVSLSFLPNASAPSTLSGKILGQTVQQTGGD